MNINILSVSGLKNLLLFLTVVLYLSQPLLSQEIYYSVRNNPTPGYLFLGLIDDYMNIACYDHSMKKPYSRQYSENSTLLIDLKMMGTDKLVAYCMPDNRWYFFNLNMQIIDSLLVPQNYTADFHDIIKLPNGNLTVFATREETVDMRPIVTDGKENAVVKNFYILEFDANRNIVFTWNALSHLDLTDVTNDVDLTAQSINPFNCNSIFYDIDGNYIISIRNFDEVAKINRSNGEFIWRMGGSSCINNQFTFINDTYNQFTGFSHQHNVQRLSNGNLLLFDNGNMKTPQVSRVAEYEINEASRTLTKVWEYKHNPSIYSRAMGNVQRLPNGNTLVGWGGNDGGDHSYLVTEITPNGNVALEVYGDKSLYRAYKLPYKMDYVTMNIQQTGNFSFNNSDYTTNVNFSVESNSGNSKYTVEKHRYKPHNIEYIDEGGCRVFEFRWVVSKLSADSILGKIQFDTQLFTGISDYTKLKIYYRNSEGNGSFINQRTSYNSITSRIEASILKPGEYFVVYNDYTAPVPNYPANNSRGISVKSSLKWERSASSEKYRLLISTDSNFTNIIFDTTDIDNTQAQPSNLSNMTRYYWKIKAYYDDCSSPWSDIFSFVTLLKGPDLYYPDNNISDLPTSIKFRWGREDSATHYRLQISKTDDFISPAINMLYADITEIQLTDFEYFTEYYWRLQAVQNEMNGEWSAVNKFRTEMSIVSLLNPPNNFQGFNNGNTLSWSSVSGAQFYNLQISTDREFLNIYLDTTGIKQQEFIFIDFQPMTEYFWRVKAFNESANSKWSSVFSLTTTIPAPDLLQPNDGYNKQKLNGSLSWSRVVQALEYEVLLAEDSNFTKIVSSVKTGKFTFEFSALRYSTTYYWKVRSINKEYISSWSEMFSFMTVTSNELTPPDLIEPQNLQFSVPLMVEFEWSELSDADSYSLQLADDMDFSINLVEVNNINETKYYFDSKQSNKTYYWRVAVVKDNVKSPWSDYRTFTTKLSNSSLLSPSNTASEVEIKPLFKWSAVEGASMYNLQIAEDSQFLNVIYLKENIQDIEYSEPTLENNTVYYWRIQPRNVENFGDYSDYFQFKTLAATDIEETETNIKIYPNPAIDELNMVCRFNPELSELEIYNLLGVKQDVQFFGLGLITTIDLRNLTTGTYLLKLNNGKDCEQYLINVIK